MGVPPGAGGNPEGEDGWAHYIEGSPISHVDGLKGDLLLACEKTRKTPTIWLMFPLRFVPILSIALSS